MVSCIGVSSSYNIMSNPAESAAEKYMSDCENGSCLRTIPIYRGTVAGIDFSKFDMAQYPGGPPIIARSVLNATDQACTRHVGGIYSELLSPQLEAIAGNYGFIPEGNDLSLSNSIRRLFNDSDADMFYFVPGDVPYAKGYTESHPLADVLIDLNTRRLLVPGLERNFYNWAKVDGTKEYFKEPNVYIFSKKGYDVMVDVSNDFFANRKGGGLYHAIIGYISNIKENNAELYSRLKQAGIPLAYEIVKVAAQKGFKINGHKVHIPVPHIDFDRANRKLSNIFELDWKFAYHHNDTFRLIDIDGLNNDWVLYAAIGMIKAKRGEEDPRLVELRNGMDKNKFPLTFDLEDIMAEYIHQVNSYMPKKHRIEFKGIQDFIDRNVDWDLAARLADLA